MSKDRREEIDRYIQELRHTVSTATLNYDVWWVFKSADTRQKYSGFMNHYILFFWASIHAHFVALIVAIYRLYESRIDTFNIPQLLAKIRSGGDLPHETIDVLDKIKEEAKPLWDKVKILRSRAFGHRSKAHTVEELFKEAKLKPNDLATLLDLTKRLMNALTSAWDGSVHAFNLSATDDVLRLLDDLKQLQNHAAQA